MDRLDRDDERDFETALDLVVFRLDVFCLTAADRREPLDLVGATPVLRLVAVLDVETAEDRLEAVLELDTVPDLAVDVRVGVPRTLDVRAAVLRTELLRASSTVPILAPETREPVANVPPALTERGRITEVPLRSKLRRL